VGVSLDTADKVLLFILKVIKVFMMLVATIHDSCLARFQDLVDKRSFISFAIGQEKFLRDALVHIKTKMYSGLF